MIRRQFLDGAQVVVDAIASPAVAAAWDTPSVLAEQTVGGLAGHLARGAVWVVGDYLDQPEPDGRDVRLGRRLLRRVHGRLR